MKRLRYLIFILIACISFNITEVFAYVETYERTPDNYRVPEYIEVHGGNIDNVMSTPSVDEKKKVYDFAGVFTDDVEEVDLYNEIMKYKKRTNYEMVIVATDNNNGKSFKDYAWDFYDYNYFEKDGILFLIDLQSRKYYVTTSGKAIDSYTDEECYYIEDELYDCMVDGDYYEAASYFITLADYYVDNNNSNFSEYQSVGSRWFKVIIFSTIGTIIVIVIMAFMNRMVKKANSSRSYLNNDTKDIRTISDMFLGSSVSKIRIDTDSSSGGGGSSISSGSSGSSHGGGGGRSF